MVPIEQLYQEADFITVHIPKKPENVGLINAQAFALMKKRPVLINTSRAAIINEADLMDALRHDSLKAVVLDVFENAPHGINWDLVKHPNVITTPHVAGVSDEGLKRVSDHISKIVTDYLKYGKINGLIEDTKPLKT